jgi:hypothetical protein
MQSIDEVKYEITTDRAGLRSNPSELRDEVNRRARQVKETVDPRTYAREYPWIALGLVIGAGFALGYSGADRKAAEGVVEGAKKAGEAITDGTAAAKDAVIERFSGHDDASPTAEPAKAARPSGIGGRLGEAVQGLLRQGLDEIMTDLRRVSS